MFNAFIKIFSLIILGCTTHPDINTEHKNNKELESMDKDSITIHKAKKYNLEKAEIAFSRPILEAEFIVDDALPEFRIQIYNYIKPQEYNTQKIVIRERTWLKDSITNLTVWYRLEKKKWIPVDALEWPKGAEF